MSFQLAIDGPAGAGKSTIAKALARELSFLYVDTGAMYRAMAYAFLQKGISAEDEENLKLACQGLEVSLGYVDGTQRVYLNGEDISGEIRREQVGNMASATSGYAFVRAKLLSLQQEIAQKQDVIMDGRDIGTCVLPHAQLKIYLTASVHTRALRRYEELQQKGVACDLAAIESDIKERDERDMTRAIAPLKQAEDAILVDSSTMSIAEVVETIRRLAEARRS